MAGHIKHGLRHTREYLVWMGIKQRCYNKHNSAYQYYGGRGIKVCDEWLYSVENFYNWLHKNGYDKNSDFGRCTVDRIDTNGDYCPENCRIITLHEQCYNRRSNNLITYNGETKTLTEWSVQYNININTLKKRLKNWGVCDKTFLFPARIGNNQFSKHNDWEIELIDVDDLKPKNKWNDLD